MGPRPHLEHTTITFQQPGQEKGGSPLINEPLGQDLLDGTVRVLLPRHHAVHYLAEPAVHLDMAEDLGKKTVFQYFHEEIGIFLLQQMHDCTGGNEIVSVRLDLVDEFLNADIAPGVKTGGGIISHVLNELEISCLPADLPTHIEVDLAQLDLGHSIHVSDIKLPKGVEMAGHHHASDAVATVYHALGIDPQGTIPDREARPMPILVNGEPIRVF